MENASQNGPAKLTRIHPFGSLSEIFSEDRFSDAFWLPLGSTLAPLWLPFAPLGSFWLSLAPFWLTSASFWLPFGALRGRFLIFNNISVLLLHFSCFGDLSWLHRRHFGCFWYLFGSITASTNPPSRHPNLESTCRQPQETPSSKEFSIQRPRAELCQRQIG